MPCFSIGNLIGFFASSLSASQLKLLQIYIKKAEVWRPISIVHDNRHNVQEKIAPEASAVREESL